MKLSDTACRNAKASDKLRKLSDGGGLQLWVQPTGAKLWRLAYRLHGKQRLLAIGIYPVISLVEARRIREDSRRDLAAGIDPSQRKRTEKLQLASGAVDGVEALLRWQHPSRGLLAPDSFIGLAERTGNIRGVSRWVLEHAVAQAHEWAARGLALRVAVNLSVRDLDDAELPARIGDLLAARGLQPQRLVLELTESAVMSEPEAAVQSFRQLADRGIDLAIDDFGIGQSSFAYLRRLPVREIKIDRLFTQALTDEAGDRVLVQSIVELGHRLGYRVTAEGVETQAALDFLRGIGCDHAQGYHIARPLAPAAIEELVARRPPAAVPPGLPA